MTPRRALAFAALSLLVLALPFGVRAQAPADLPFRNPDLPVEKRIDDLVGRLTLDEKVSLMI
jgi:beta-glucosidase